MAAEEKKLSAKEERFCLEYIVDYNKTEAAIRAGYKEKSARTQAWRMLKNETIAARVRELQHEYNEMSCFASKDRYNAELWKNYLSAKKNGDEKTMCKMLELIGKMGGMMEPDKKDRFGKGGIEISVSVAGGEGN